MADLKKNYEEIKGEMHSKLVWCGENSHYALFKGNRIQLTRNRSKYDVIVNHIGTTKRIEITCIGQVELEKLYLLLGEIRQFEYLFEGAFFLMRECLVDDEDITAVIQEVELGYFQSSKYLHEIPVVLTDAEYKKYFLRWVKLARKRAIINQMILYASNVNGITSDVRLAMLAESFNMLAKKMEKENLLSIIPEPDTYSKITCQHCGQLNSKRIKGRKTLSCCLNSVIGQYGMPVFSTEYRRRKSLITHIVKTRNKVFHVDSGKRGYLSGGQCGFYSVKLDWMYRYVCLIQIGIDKTILDNAISKKIRNCSGQYLALAARYV
ncbi:MAG: hypothetical protein LUF35_02875 [Lachnospiraceae bacterium]|nr:hypothetical protein [Lachnospiraceae bacterium]